jgi:CRISPR-associated protein Cmr6
MRDAMKALRKDRSRDGRHPGLLLQRYLCEPATGDDGNPEEKRAILAAAVNASQRLESVYKAAFQRWKAQPRRAPAWTRLATAGRLIVGLGSENVLETGIRLHHSYGAPVIPGSALKGLAAHYCDRVWGAADKEFKKPSAAEDQAYANYLAGKGPKPGERSLYRLFFGNTDDGGCIVFEDAWITPESLSSALHVDVMTPHHPKWNDLENPRPPTDFDSPVPVPFLSVSGEFEIVLQWNGPALAAADQATKLAAALLEAALDDWGVGGKTSSGYGRLVEPSAAPISHKSSTQQPSQKRESGTKVKVKILETRKKGGFQVVEVDSSRNPGALTLGNPPAGVNAAVGEVVDVEVHVDDSRNPQYRWPSTPKKAPQKKKR